ncbi:WhiB family transcriptional regulator [Rhodococcus sp. NPDC127530]|uniref:WhiB family transcriptional regulator n=1 Tax=unclassified Rhodococcus (in: high G+C Gram-positive bacteria) TaxID=192944 RepID=UPI003628AC47
MPAKLPKLPIPISEVWDWQLSAACRGTDTTIFYHPDNERGEARSERIRVAKLICDSCPVRAACLNYALETAEPHGTWGGFTEEERKEWRLRKRFRSLREDRERRLNQRPALVSRKNEEAEPSAAGRAFRRCGTSR